MIVCSIAYTLGASYSCDVKPTVFVVCSEHVAQDVEAENMIAKTVASGIGEGLAEGKACGPTELPSRELAPCAGI